jgi:Uma2 family endonuclease
MSTGFTPTPTKITVQRFQDLIAAGVLRDDDQIGLVDGKMIGSAPIEALHAWTAHRMSEVLRKHAAPVAHVWVQLPVALADLSQPQPDLALIRSKPEGYRRELPREQDILLVIEVSDSTLAYDQGPKQRLYAKHNIPEYWIVDVQAKRVEVYRGPSGNGYLRTLESSGEDVISPQECPQVKVQLIRLFAD